MQTAKESSDELNTTVATPFPVEHRPARSPKDYLALSIATCGVGYFPIAPGTWGSLVGVGLYLGMRSLLVKLIWPSGNPVQYNLVIFELLVILIISLVGIWAASRTEALSGKKDPGKVVIDEVAGQMLALVAVPLNFGSRWPIVAGFFAFRLFDIIKPYPARRLESLKSGLGIVADDIVAGAYAALVVGLGVILGIV